MSIESAAADLRASRHAIVRRIVKRSDRNEPIPTSLLDQADAVNAALRALKPVLPDTVTEATTP